MIATGGSSTACTNHMDPRPGLGADGCNGRHSHPACFMALHMAARSVPKGHGPTMKTVRWPWGKYTVSGLRRWWIAEAWLAITRRPFLSPTLANPMIAGLVCFKCMSSWTLSFGVQTTTKSANTSVPSAERGSQKAPPDPLRARSRCRSCEGTRKQTENISALAIGEGLNPFLKYCLRQTSSKGSLMAKASSLCHRSQLQSFP